MLFNITNCKLMKTPFLIFALILQEMLIIYGTYIYIYIQLYIYIYIQLYIYRFSKNSGIQPISILETLDEETLRKYKGKFPNKYHGSDHISLAVDFKMSLWTEMRKEEILSIITKICVCKIYSMSSRPLLKILWLFSIKWM